MIDKVQKIREEVERIQLYTQSEVLKQVLDYIDKVQEEPVSELWHDSNKEQPKAESDVAIWDGESGEILTRCVKVNPNRKWAYMEELLNKKEEPVSEDLGEYINELSKQFPEVSFAKLSRIAVRVAKWQKEYIWKPADGDDLPIIDREVIALLDNGKVVFAHRPNPNGWDGKSVTTGKVEHYTPKTYGEGGWNIPNIVYWLDVEFPKEIEL